MVSRPTYIYSRLVWLLGLFVGFFGFNVVVSTNIKTRRREDVGLLQLNGCYLCSCMCTGVDGKRFAENHEACHPNKWPSLEECTQECLAQCPLNVTGPTSTNAPEATKEITTTASTTMSTTTTTTTTTTTKGKSKSGCARRFRPRLM